MKFRLLRGMHVQAQGTPAVGNPGDAKYVPASDDYLASGRVFNAREKNNNVIECDEDLVAKFGAEKYERLDSAPRRSDEFKPGKTGQEDGAPQGGGAHRPLDSTLDKGEPAEDPKNKDKQTEDDGLNDMTVSELREWAAAAEVDLAGKTRKDEIIAAIRAAK